MNACLWVNFCAMGEIRPCFPHKTAVRLRRYVHHTRATPCLAGMFLETQDSREEEVKESDYERVVVWGGGSSH